MNSLSRVAGFTVGLAAVFAAAFGLGTWTGTIGAPGPSSTDGPAGHGANHSATDGTAADAGLPGGLMVSQDGYTLDLAERQLATSSAAPLQFRILGPDGEPVLRYSTERGKDLHLVAVRRDLAGFQHVHPQLDSAGTWSVPLDLSDAGVYRVFADFTPADRPDGLTLGADLSVAGGLQPQPLPATSRTAEVDGYTVTLDGTLVPGHEAELTLFVSKDGRPVTDLQPYLEAYGHLVALRDRDLAYLHVHPAGSPHDGTTPPGPGITFYATVPSAGDYRLFLDFRHDDQVRTAAFTLTAGSPTAPAASADPHEAGDRPTATADPSGHGHGG